MGTLPEGSPRFHQLLACLRSISNAKVYLKNNPIEYMNDDEKILIEEALKLVK